MFLICSAMVMIYDMPAIEVCKLFEKHESKNYLHAASNPCTTFTGSTVLACVMGIEYAKRLGWFNLEKFDVEAFEKFDECAAGHMNWIVPNQFLAFPGPHSPENGEASRSDDRVREVRRDGGIKLVTHEPAFVTRDTRTRMFHPRVWEGGALGC